MAQYPEFLCVKVTPVEKRKVKTLAERTGRSVSQVVRVLIARAELASVPDICLAPVIGDKGQGGGSDGNG